jgi:23S rRNA pseudouridine2605 synthase
MTEPNAIRLQKLIADNGLCSRRQAEVWITEGLVSVNGKPAQLGQKAIPGKDKIIVNGRRLTVRETEPVTLLMNKPRGVICSNGDPYHNKTVFDLVPPPYNRERLFCAGRLDKDSEGLLILTSDGDLTNRLTHPTHRIIKRYNIVLSKPFLQQHIRVMLNGFEVEGEKLKAEKIIVATEGDDPEFRLEIHLEHGRKREIRRMLEHLGYFVKRLQRFQIGSLKIRGVSPGRCRPLSKKEIELLLEGADQ